MQVGAAPILKDIVLVGGGHAHVGVIKSFGMNPIDGARITLISPDSHTPYSGMLPGLIAGHYSYDEAHIDLRPLCRFAGVAFLRTEVERVDPLNKLIHCPDRPPIAYDVLSINAGSTPDPRVVPGAAGNVIPVKPVAAFLDSWLQLKAEVLRRPSMRIGVVGGGAGGVELALSAQFALSNALATRSIDARPTFHIITRGAQILDSHNAKVRNIFQRVLAERSIDVLVDFPVDRVEGTSVINSDRRAEFDQIIWVAGAEPARWIADSGLATDARGFLAVDEYLRSISHQDVFGAGDIAGMIGSPRPKSGVFAVRQGPPLAHNLRASVLSKPLTRYRPQKAFLGLISTGDKYAVASRGAWSTEGAWVWRWKDWIDRRFMDRFNKLPEMTPAKPHRIDRLPSSARERVISEMRCGGCGAKVGADTLSRVLAQLKPIERDGIVAGLAARDDSAILDVPPGKLLVQSTDMFRSMIDDPHVFGRVSANHALGDLYAMGAEPWTALAIATVPYGLPDKTAATLAHVLSGALEVLNAAGCTLVGGHTAEAAELALGLTVNGLIETERALRKGGLQAGDQLILTKPLGTGTLFAADMRAKAKGRWVDAAIETALTSNQAASSVLRAHGATACTDVTGFGLVGHLTEMLEASGRCATLRLDSLPVIDGAIDTIEMGIVSSLQPENEARQDRLRAAPVRKSDPRFRLLFDPQTAGGLLAGIPKPEVEACLAALHAAGYEAATVIGEVDAEDVTRGTLILT